MSEASEVSQQYLTYDQVAERFQCSRKTVHRMVKYGIPGTTPPEPFPVFRLGRLVRFHESDVMYVAEKLRMGTLAPHSRPRPEAVA